MSVDRRTQLAPVDPRQRIAELDILRGFALFGILVVNMGLFGAPDIYLELAGIDMASGGADRLAKLAIRFFAQEKFISIFSFLFGVGMALQVKKSDEAGTRYGPFATRRYIVLLLFGLFHGVFIWMGDILTAYALFAFWLLFFGIHRRPLRAVLIWAGTVISAPLLLTLWFAVLQPFMSAQDSGAAGMTSFFAQLASQATEAYQLGTYLEITMQRALDFAFMLGSGPFWLPLPLGLFLLGLYAGRSGIATDPSAHLPLIRRATLVGLAVGVLGSGIATAAYDSGGYLADPSWLGVLVSVSRTVGAPALAFFYMGGITLLCRRPVWQRRLGRLGAAGRMALTNYLLQSVIATTIFYSYGFGLYGRVGTATGLLITAGIYLLQLWWSPIWLRRFRFGPAEWLWRTLAYGRTQPMRRQAPSGETSM